MYLHLSKNNPCHYNTLQLVLQAVLTLFRFFYGFLWFSIDENAFYVYNTI